MGTSRSTPKQKKTRISKLIRVKRDANSSNRLEVVSKSNVNRVVVEFGLCFVKEAVLEIQIHVFADRICKTSNYLPCKTIVVSAVVACASICIVV